MENFEINYDLKPENGKYDPAKWNARDANEVKQKFDAFVIAVSEALQEKDEQIRALQEENLLIKQQIELGLFAAGVPLISPK
jgi:hypothetical protein